MKMANAVSVLVVWGDETCVFQWAQTQDRNTLNQLGTGLGCKIASILPGAVP